MELANVDYLSATIDIEDYEKVANGLLILLEEKKEEAKHIAKESVNSITYVQLRSRLGEPRWIDFQVMPNGAPRYAYILHNDSFEIKLAQYRAKNEDVYPVQIRIKSEILWSLGVQRAWDELKNIIESSVGKIIEARISRLDLACHTDLIDFNTDHLERFKGNHITDQLIRENREVSGLNFGSRSTKKIYVRIYDKSLEVRKKGNKNWFYDIWSKNNAVGKVWNVEYELNRDIFKELNINTVDEALNQIKSLWNYCTSKHLVLTLDDTTRIERAEIDSDWQKIQRAYDEYRGDYLIKRTKQLSDNADALIPAICGYITSYASKLGMIDINEIMDELKTQGLDYIENRKKSTVQDEVISKAKLIYNSHKSEVVGVQ